ncbi:28S ribosomal protein S15, mitochondrial-like [Anneissia japonica]|uniref:28S ribosomal protein S15, mitochondrial-like n=1 Tax=Anneissia japonica TaxID=1529436 RepID=UPI001425B8C9|nr:28S ribosomal protein S15, mitochondrial-like [Anneissia japonica]
MILRGISRLLRPNIYINVNITSAIHGTDFVGPDLGLGLLQTRAAQQVGRRLSSLVVGHTPVYGFASLNTLGLRQLLSQVDLTNKSKGSISSTQLTQKRFYASRIKPKKKKPVKDLEPVIHNLDRYYGLEPSKPKLYFEEVEALNSANDDIKKMFSLEFASNAEIKEYKSCKLLEEIKEELAIDPHAHKKTLPLRIALLTMAVRNCGKHVIKNPKDKANKRKMLINIDRRRKFLRRLRRQNYNQFENIQRELGIKWVPTPKFEWLTKTRRQIERRLIKDKAHWERIAAQKEFAKQRRKENMIEIVRLKKELGKDLTEEEKQYDQINNNI